MTLPNFLVIGAMKCATSTVCGYLEQQPEVFMVPRGEPNYFSHDANFAKGPEWYGRFFEGCTTEPIRGEGSNDYASGALYPETAARIAAFDPGMRIIYMVRHPLDRIASAWVQNRADSGDAVPATLDRAVREMPDRYVDVSLYWKNLQRYRAHFPDAQILLGFMEDLSADPDTHLARIARFLGVSEAAPVRRAHVNPTSGKRVPGVAYTAVNRLPFSAGLKAMLPEGLRRAVKTRLLSRPTAGLPRLSATLRAELMPLLQADSAALLAHAGKPPDFWRFD